MSHYCLSFFDGKDSKSFFRTDFNSVDSLMNEVLKALLTRKNHQKTVYIHNSSEFDLIFILKNIISHKETKVEPIIKNGKFINLKVLYGPNGSYIINFKDSYLLLPVSLSNLAKTFNVKTLKSVFPHNFVTKNLLGYVGSVPSFRFFDNISLTEYQSYCKNFINNNWSLRNEAVKYCEIDCVALYQVIETFARFIFERFQINISSVSTLPSLALKIFRAHFLPKNIKIPVLTGKIYDDICQAYYGGLVDMYIPTNPDNTVVYEYDMNALYPNAMASNLYPTKLIAYFRGDIRKMTEYAKLLVENLSFLKVKETSPEGLANPILPYKCNGVTIYPEGTWTGWYYIGEVMNALNYGYKFEILEGYLFEASEIFSSYVENLNTIKEHVSKNDPWYTIAKLLLNSLVGRFGMKPKLLNYTVVNNKDLSSFISQIGLENLVDQVELGESTILSYWVDFSRTPKINIAIASAITANARVRMSEIKNHPDYILYYTDTDSAFLNRPLQDHLVDDKKIGLFKLEKMLKNFVALGPKVYGGIEIDGTEFTKVKGLKTKVAVSQLEELLIKDSSTKVEQKKWFNNLTESTISVKKSAYSLKPTDSKRNLVFKDGKLVGTSNKVINE
uniref:DNA polymerase n=1 Tax=Phellinus igniarius TaxID=40472 RepID=UPI00233F6CD5|nr:DNA polymerase [Phellinus igniarius]WBU93171.1 DNA polymerase [Phellinus igniarius]